MLKKQSLGVYSEFRVSGEVADNEDFVEIHNGDLGFRFDVVFWVNSCIRIDASNMLHVAYIASKRFTRFCGNTLIQKWL